MTVTVYTKPDCPACDATKKYLDRDSIPYSTVDVSTDENAYELVKSLGYSYTPVVVSGNVHWSGFRPDKIASLKLMRDRVANSVVDKQCDRVIPQLPLSPMGPQLVGSQGPTSF